MAKYSFKDIKDKSKEGMDKELEEGLIKIAVYFNTTHGMPLDMFNDLQYGKNKAEQLMFYMNFRNSNPKLFNG